ncbi:MAG: ATP-binding protein [Bacilli bacterium]|nr:ATP-binding protein [Bacilli bacterium]
MNVVSVTLNLVCLGFLMFLLIIYYSKNNMNNLENKVYKGLLLVDFLLVVSELLFLFLACFMRNNLLLVGLFKRFSFYFTIIFMVLIMIYVIIVCVENNDRLKELFSKYNNFVFKFIFLIVLVISFFQFSLPIDYSYDSNYYIAYAFGPSTSTLVAIVGVLIIIIIVPFLLLSWKIVNKKKLFSFAVISLLEIVSIIILLLFPEISITSFTMSIICYLMFFTIENPDIKLVNELTLAKTQAEKANNAKTDFLASMSHELRTPLNAIVGLSQMIKDESTDESSRDDALDIYVASNNLLELVDGILDYNKLESNRMEIIDIEYKPRDVFDSLIKMMNIRIGNKPITFNCNISDKLPEVLHGDRENIKKITFNILSNAIKYTDQGSVDFVVACDIKDDDCLLKICVSDTGRGIKEEQKKVLFTKFNRREEDKDSDISGTGLGLAITKSLLDLMGGKIDVDSKYGEGSTFTVEVNQKVVTPAQEKKEEEVEKEEKVVDTSVAVEEDKDRQYTIMVVDDNKLNLRVTTKLLEDYNFDVVDANSGFECLEKVKSKTYDLIFMDIMMPDMDGVESNNFNGKVIALTADAMAGSREKYLNEGFDFYIPKPINRVLLEEALNKYIKVDDYRK